MKGNVFQSWIKAYLAGINLVPAEGIFVGTHGDRGKGVDVD